MRRITQYLRHTGFLKVLRHELKTSLTVLLSGLMQGSAAWRLRGVMFSPELAVAGTVPNTRLDTPTWKAVIDDSDAVRGRKLGFNWLKNHGKPADAELQRMVTLIQTRNRERGPVAI